MVGLIKVKVGKKGRIDRRKGIYSKRATGSVAIQGVVIKISQGELLATCVENPKEVKMIPGLIQENGEKPQEDLGQDQDRDHMTKEENIVDILDL
jgi:hypothetical protein